MDAPRFDKLSERQRGFLRLVYEHHDTKSIARLTGEPSIAAIDKQISLAAGKLGATSRVEAARMLRDYEQGIRSSELQPSELVRPGFLPLPLPLPTASRPTNTMTWRQVLFWGAIIALAAHLLLAFGATTLIALVQLVGGITT